MKPKKSRPQLPLPYLIPADFRLPESLLNQAMLRVAVLLNRGICKEFYWVCNHINVEGKVDVSFDATQLAIHWHAEAGRVLLRKRTKSELKFCEQAQSSYTEENDFYDVVPDDSLFTWWEEQESGDTNAATANSSKPIPPRLTVDLACKTVTLDGTKYDVSSDNAIRWVKVLAEHPGEWISGPQLEEHDSKLMKARPDRWKQKYLPDAIRGLIDSETGKGSRIRL